MTDFIVSICCITYNHEPYIKQCIDGFLMQKTTFKFEIIIHDDASTDNTADIIREYEAKFPNIIKPIYQTENQYSKGIDIWTTYLYPRVKRKYVTICEGDDYWTDPYKLQNQVNYMESHPTCGLVYSKVLYYYQKINKYSKKAWGGTAVEFSELIDGNKIPTLTSMFRRDLLGEYMNEIRPEIHNWKMGDYPIWLYMSLKSKIYFMNEVTGIYRVLNESVSHSSDMNKIEAFTKSYFDIKVFFLKYANVAYDKQKLNDALHSRLATSALLLNRSKESLGYLDQIKNPRKMDMIKKTICKSNILVFIYKIVYSKLE